jgi:hypothetical protein
MKPTDNNEYSEIELSDIPQKMGNLFAKLSHKLNSVLIFLIDKAKILVPLFVIGFGIGFYLDTKPNAFRHEVIVYPNFESTDYLYTKVDLLNSKIKLRDTVFFQQIQLDKELKLVEVKVVPISDPFLLVDENKEYLDLVKILLDGSDMDKLFASETMIRKFKSHKIELISKNKIEKTDYIIENIITYLNDNEYFEKKKQQEVSNIERTIAEYEIMNEQANVVLKSINSRSSNTTKSENISINNEYISYNEILKVKEEMLENRNKMNMKLVLFDKTIKDIQTSKNLLDKKYLKGYSKFIIPFLLIFIFFMSMRVSKFMIKYRAFKAEFK